MKKAPSLGLVCLTALFFAPLWSCSSPLKSETPHSGVTGGMVLTAENPEAHRNLLPTGAEITAYGITGAGPGGVSLPTTTDTADGVFLLRNLVAGDWSVTVTAKDAGGTAVARGTAVLAVTGGVTGTVRLPLVPVSGQGWLSLECSWPAGQDVDAVTATFIRSDETQTSVPLLVQGSKASLKDWELPSGGFLLTLELTKNLVRVAAPRMESVLVYAGKSTEGSFSLGPSDFDPGTRTKSVLTFGFASPAAVGVVDEAAHTISVVVPTSTDLSNLTPTITISGASISPSSGTAADFRTPRPYTVTAQDGGSATYTVTVIRSGDQGVTVQGPVLVTVTLSGQQAVLASGTSMTVTATATDTVDSRFWYLDGQKVAGVGGATWTGGETLLPGPHSLMGVVSKDGLLFSSTCYFTVE